jgi:hypothetical protein
MTSNSEKRAAADKQFRATHPEPECLDLFEPSAEWLAWDAARRQAVHAAAPWDASDEADLAGRGTTLADGTVTY